MGNFKKNQEEFHCCGQNENFDKIAENIEPLIETEEGTLKGGFTSFEGGEEDLDADAININLRRGCSCSCDY